MPLSVVIVHGAKNIPMELDGLIVYSPCACAVVIVHVGIYIYMELNGLTMFNRFAFQSVASWGPINGPPRLQPLAYLIWVGETIIL